VARIKRELRYELKYLIRREQQVALTAALAEYMTPDEHAAGSYPITSLYYDTPDYRCYWDKLDGHRVRRKVRVRVYGSETVTPATPCYLEIKQRINMTMRKRRVALPYGEAIAFDDFDQPRPDLDAAPRATLQEVYYLYRTLQLRPACIVAYQRTAWEGAEYYPDLRVTFDTDLRGRTHDLSLTSTSYAANQFFLPPEVAVLEVKANYNVPGWLAHLLSRHNCTYRRISKYCAALEHSKVITARQRVSV
jgi:hypothetical protein